VLDVSSFFRQYELRGEPCRHGRNVGWDGFSWPDGDGCRPAKHAHLSKGCSSDEELEAVEANEVCWAEVAAGP